MVINDELIEYLEALTRLELSDAERERAKSDFTNIIGYMDKLNELDADNVEATTHVVPIENVLRDDVVLPSYDRDELMANAPAKKDGQFKVPKTVE